MSIRVEPLPTPLVESGVIEVVERKGLGHPDTICDAIAEEASRALSRRYVEKFGVVLHHNVDKALLVGGVAAPAFGGGRVMEPIEIFLAGRAVRALEGVEIGVDDLVIEAGRNWLRDHLHALDHGLHVRMHSLVRPGSVDLDALDATRRRTGVVRSNDTSCGVGYAPLSRLERAVRAVETRLRMAARDDATRFVGEDVKVLGVREGSRIALTVACAFVDKWLPDLDAYREAKKTVLALARHAAGDLPGALDVQVNAADDLARGEVYLTVTGTSAESGDDGEVGRGNRVNGLIAPLRPTSLEATAGKNPISHVGKLYNVAATEIAQAIVDEMSDVAEAQVVIVSRIGAPIEEPQIAALRLAPKRGELHRYADEATRIARKHLSTLPALSARILRGEVQLF